MPAVGSRDLNLDETVGGIDFNRGFFNVGVGAWNNRQLIILLVHGIHIHFMLAANQPVAVFDGCDDTDFTCFIVEHGESAPGMGLWIRGQHLGDKSYRHPVPGNRAAVIVQDGAGDLDHREWCARAAAPCAHQKRAHATDE